MRILAIESSCDETSAAVVEQRDSKIIVHSNITATSIAIHAQTGGIIPENAAREQVKYIIPVIIEALKLSVHGSRLTANEILEKNIDAIAVTYGPGLIGSLLVGVETAKTLSFTLQKPIIPVHHLLAHIFANFINNNVSFPFIGLVVSGAHTDLLYFKSATNYQWLGGTKDDAAGECFDKCARLLGFDYPGGPKISKLAEKGTFKKELLPKIMKGNDLDFSFSGLKTAFMNVVKAEFEVSNTPNGQGYSWIHANIETLPQEKQQLLYNLCASLEQTIVEVLVRKTLHAAKSYGVQTILLGGGVSANKTLVRQFQLEVRGQRLEIDIFSPEKIYCTDNAAMIGAYALLNPKEKSWKSLHAQPDLYFS